jgi:hypothetical protein
MTRHPGKISHKPNIIIEASELNRIRESTVKSMSDTIRQDPLEVYNADLFNHEFIQSSEIERQEKAKMKRERILSLEQHRKDTSQAAPEDSNAHFNKQINEKARQALEEEIDEVKRINQMIALAKVQTILDVQLAEKQRLKEAEALSRKQADEAMEQERLKALAQSEEAERKRSDEHRQKSQAIFEQMKEREKLKLLEEETKIKERLWMQKKIEQDRSAEQQRMIETSKEQRQHLDEILLANNDAINRKIEEKNRNREEDMRLLEYHKALEEKERAREEELLQEAAKREIEIAKLRSLQERAKNKEEELDALRAKRAMEAAERALREKEKKEAAALAEMNMNLAEARRIQHREKQKALIEQARAEKEEHDRLKDIQAEKEAAEKRRLERERQMRDRHACEIQSQIQSNRDRKLKYFEAVKEEGKAMRESVAAEQARLKEIRKAKLDLLLRSGVPEKHCLNLKKALQS